MLEMLRGAALVIAALVMSPFIGRANSSARCAKTSSTKQSLKGTRVPSFRDVAYWPNAAKPECLRRCWGQSRRQGPLSERARRSDHFSSGRKVVVWPYSDGAISAHVFRDGFPVHEISLFAVGQRDYEAGRFSIVSEPDREGRWFLICCSARHVPP
jgi:hypothetical protein